MKKKIAFIAILALSCLFVSCTNQPTTVVNNNYIVAEFQDGVLPYAGYAGTSDTVLVAGASYGDFNYGTSGQGGAGYGAYSTNASRYLVKFDVGSIPSGVAIKKAYLTLYCYMQGGSGTVSAHKKTSTWTEGVEAGATGTPSWNSTTGGLTYDAAAMSSAAIAGDKYYSFELSAAMVQEWVNDSGNNHGVLLKGDNEASTSYLWFYFSEAGSAWIRPKLTVYYTLE